MGAKKVVVEGGGQNLYHIAIHGREHTVSHVDVGLLMNDYKTVGRANSLEDALNIIKSHSGQQIKEVRDWT